MQRGRYARKRQKSFKAALVLIVALVAVFMAAVGFRRSGLPSTLATLLNADFENFRNLAQFDSLKAREVQKSLAGFWIYEEGDPETDPVSKREYLELIDNGMIWTVAVWDVNLPNERRETFKHVKTAYFNPYSISPEGDYYCETRVIRQAFVNGADTCYGESQADEIWQMAISRNGETLTAERREYVRYEGEIKDFFPDVALLDVPGMINIRKCPAAMSLSWASKRAVGQTLPIIPFFTRAQAVDEAIHIYYRPLVLDELKRRYDPRAVPDEMPVRLTIAPNGTVTNLRYKRANIVTRRFDDLATLEIRSWGFPPIGETTEESQTLDITIRVKP